MHTPTSPSPGTSSAAAPQHGWVTDCQPGVDTAVAGPLLEKLYGNLYASLPHIVLDRGLDHCHTYTASADGAVHTLLLFQLRGARVDVLNETIPLDNADIDALARTVYARYPQVRVIAFRAIWAQPYAGSYPCQQHNYLEDTVIALPDNMQAYTAGLSKNTQRNVRRCKQAVRQKFPGLAFQMEYADETDPQHVLATIALNHARMAQQYKQSGLGARESQRILSLAARNGMTGVITIDGVVRAGAVGCRVGDNYFLMVLAHDPAYDEYSLGFLCCYLTICACIERGIKEFHFLWGRYDYKRAFLGIRRDLDEIVLYRTRAAQARHAMLAASVWRRACARQWMLWLHERSQHRSPQIKLALTALGWLRRACRQLGRLRGVTLPRPSSSAD
jgi:hypothetical protein